MFLVNEMLDKLDEHYKKEHNNKSIFTLSSLKWYDPANGIGNFPVAIFLRLFEGLKEEIPDDEARRKHILENMLYMSELTASNVVVCKHIFKGDKYKLNLYNGNSLELDTVKEWNVEKMMTMMREVYTNATL